MPSATEALLSLFLLTSPPEMATVANRPPASLSVIACRVVDKTGLPGRQNPKMAAPNWKDLEWYINQGLELECKREVIENMDDSTQYAAGGTGKEIPLDPDWSHSSECAARAMEIGPRWNDAHPGWAVLAIGCPVPIKNYGADGIKGTFDDEIVGYKLPECPTFMPGTENRMKCSYDESAV